jgi:predicted phage baseplate assembly protein
VTVPLSVPALDDRTYQQLVAEALRRIPVHNPAWNNFNDSDPGMTLLQLFAFMHESVLYRVNTFPERNRLKFLSLLGIALQPAAPAAGRVTIQNERGPLASATVPANLEVRAGPIRFRTTSGLDVLPVEARVFSKRKLPEPQTADEQAELDTYRLLYEDLRESPAFTPAFYATTPL